MKNIILDTDLGTDSDDIGALSILCNLHRQGKINLIAVTSCSSAKAPLHAIDAICNCYGVSVPTGKSFAPYGEDAQHGAYARAIECAYPSRITEVLDAVDVLRKALLQGNVTLVTIGPLNNIAHLLESNGDELSPLSGKELFSQYVVEMYSMAGTFTNSWAEWNILEDVQSMQIVANSVRCPWTLVPFEVGVKVKTGARFLKGVDCPMKLGYYVHNITPRESWDPITAYCAATDCCLNTSPWGKLHVDDRGVTTLENICGNCRYVKDDFDVEKLTEELEKLMVI